MKFFQTVKIPEVSQDEYVEQVKDVYGDDVSKTEALELLYAKDAPVDAQLFNDIVGLNPWRESWR
tara:strand:- start:979 stop:1173 length:195 start_codon:yes stop_codon:yes gene_type:complete